MWSTLCLILVVGLTGVLGSCRGHPDGTCLSPIPCVAPTDKKYSSVRPVQMRQQWDDSDGYCGSLAVQTIVMAYGAWVSQDHVRKAAGGGQHGSEIYYKNIGRALDTLKWKHDDWDFDNEPQPQYKKFSVWMKKHIMAGAGIVWMILDKSFDLRNYTTSDDDGPNPAFSHIEPVFGIYTDHKDTDTYYPDDILVHGSDYCAGTRVEGPRLYRPFSTLYDTESMRGNCRNAGGTIGQYPCIMEDQDIGYSIPGPVEGGTPSIPVSLLVDRYDEPDFPWTSEKPVGLVGSLTVNGPLEVGSKYVILRWDDYRKVPTDGNYLTSKYDQKYPFTAKDKTYKFKDPNTILSSGTTYYRVVKAP